MAVKWAIDICKNMKVDITNFSDSWKSEKLVKNGGKVSDAPYVTLVPWNIEV